MSRAADRRRQQQDELDAQVAIAHERPNEPPTPVPPLEQCPARPGRRCSYAMKGSDGIYRCWYCCRRRPEARA